MSATLLLPRLGETMETGRVVTWLKQPGERFRRGETVVEIETDKTVVELPALEDGEMTEILAADGAELSVGAPLCHFTPTRQAETAAAPKPTTSVESPAGSDDFPAIADGPSPGTEAPRGAPLRATPHARRMARDAHVDIARLRGTGRRGRIEAADVRAAMGAGSAAATSGNVTIVNLPQGRLAVRHWGQAGRAPRIVLLHGFGGDSQSWTALGRRLARDGAEVLAPDLPGHGQTDIAADTLADLADPIAAWLVNQGEGNELVGHSLGAVVATMAAAATRPRRLTLMAPAGFGSAIDADFVTGTASAQSSGALAHLLRRLALNPPSLSDTQRKAMLAAHAGRLRALAAVLVHDGRQQIDLIGPLSAVDTPTQIIWGTEDRIVPWTQAAAAPSNIAVHFVQGAGHMVHWDRPDVVALLLNKTSGKTTGGRDD